MPQVVAPDRGLAMSAGDVPTIAAPDALELAVDAAFAAGGSLAGADARYVQREVQLRPLARLGQPVRA